MKIIDLRTKSKCPYCGNEDWAKNIDWADVEFDSFGRAELECDECGQKFLGSSNPHLTEEEVEEKGQVPAPWFISQVEGSDSIMVGGGDGSMIVADVRTDYGELTVRKHSLMVAAAPELLACCEAFLHNWDNGTGNVETGEFIAMFRNAVERAGGKHNYSNN